MARFVRIGALDDDTVEVVEHKGLGHPDTLCDALADELGRALCRHYLRTFGTIFHHNVDKALIVGGSSRPAFGGGKVVDPIEIDLAGRATRTASGIDIPLADIAEQSTERWIQENMHALGPHHWKLAVRVRGGSAELVDLFASADAVPLANDTSIGVGHAPLSATERTVLAVGKRLRALIIENPEIGEDTKVMAVREGDRLALLVACAFVGQWLSSMRAYTTAKEKLAAEVQKAARREFDGEIDVKVNAADDEARGRIFLTVTGTSAEGGDDGQVGRGNRANGLITPYRPMTLEAFAGKNPVSHVGKTYSVLAQRIAVDVARRTSANRAECVLVSRIGQRVDQPGLAHVRLSGPNPQEVRHVVEAIVAEHLGKVGSVWRDLLGWEG